MYIYILTYACTIGASFTGDAGAVVERLERDLSALSEGEKARLLEAEAPELAALLEDFKVNLSSHLCMQPLELTRGVKLWLTPNP